MPQFLVVGAGAALGAAARYLLSAALGGGMIRDVLVGMPVGALYAGSPETVARKIARTVQDLGLDRFDLKYATGTLSHESMMRSIELYGREVVPRVRALLG